MKKYSIFQNYYFQEGEWELQRLFYLGDLSGIAIANDWRFKQVFGIRQQAQFIGCADLDFPIQYPIKINDNFSVLEVAKTFRQKAKQKYPEDADLFDFFENKKAALIKKQHSFSPRYYGQRKHYSPAKDRLQLQ